MAGRGCRRDDRSGLLDGESIAIASVVNDDDDDDDDDDDAGCCLRFLEECRQASRSVRARTLSITLM